MYNIIVCVHLHVLAGFSSPNGFEFAVNSAIRGYKVDILCPSETSIPSKFNKTDDVRHIIFTAETHNFPTGGFLRLT